jgi:alkanesulfonate monooxygenase SsuD/methylene tetrahydromethanopterin reductase-like flavin-dependent oxidoreductase (luciferase family)
LLLAEQIALADHLTEGRLEVGFARGSYVYEYERLGIRTEIEAGERMMRESGWHPLHAPRPVGVADPIR